MRFREIEKIILADGWQYKGAKALIVNTHIHQSREKLQSQNIPGTSLRKQSNKFSNKPGYKSSVLHIIKI